MLSKEKIQSLSRSKIHSSASRNKVFPLLSLACTYFWKQATASSSTASMSPSSPSRTLFLNKSSRNSSSMLTADGWYRRARAFFIDKLYLSNCRGLLAQLLLKPGMDGKDRARGITDYLFCHDADGRLSLIAPFVHRDHDYIRSLFFSPLP